MHDSNRPMRGFRYLSFTAILLVFASVVGSSSASAQTPETKPEPVKIDWHKGPFTAKLGTVAEIKVPDGYEFADGDGARRYLEMTGNPSGGNEVGILTPVGNAKEDDWIVLFDFDETGYIKDDEKASIDAPKLFESMKKGTEEENEERKKRGWMAFHLIGWQTQPFYDDATHNLTWATIGNTDDAKRGETINYATRILGRRGVMRTDLVIDPSQSTVAVPKFKTLMTGFSFTSGSQYADFVQGDKVAKYGLTALIAGGATAVALKTGFFAKMLALLAGLWKLLAVGIAALLTRIKSIFAAIRRKFSGEEKAPSIDDM